MKVLSQETNLGSDITVDNATVVRTYNSDTDAATVTRKDSGGSTVGSLTVPSKKVIYLEKKSNDTLIAPSTVKASKIAYSPMMQYASWVGGDGGAPPAGGYNTISVTNSWNVIVADTNTDGVFTQGLSACTTVPESGKRVYFIHMCYRLTGSESYTDYEDFFKPSGQGGNATVTLAGHTPTYQACAKTAYNAVALYTGTADLNTSGSSQSITFSFNNSGESDAAGGWALSIMTYDYVDEFAQNTAVINSNTEGATTAGPLNVSPPGAGTGWQFSTKLVTGVASNPPDNVNPSWTKGSGESDTTYSILQEGDNGTNEVNQTSRSQVQPADLSNITGTMGLDSGSANTGVGVMGTYIRFKATQQ
jgi:hypothetical protein